MEAQQAIREVLKGLPEDRVREVLDFVRFVAQASESDEWRRFGQSQLAGAYGDDEPEYGEADIKSEPTP